MSEIRVIVEQGVEGEKLTGLGYFQDGDLVGKAILQQVKTDLATGNTKFFDVPVFVLKDEKEE